MVKSDMGVVESFFAFMVKRAVSLAVPSTRTASVVTVGLCRGAIVEGTWTLRFRQPSALSEPWQLAPTVL